MTDIFKTFRKAARLVRNRRPIAATFALQEMLAPPLSKPVRKRPKKSVKPATVSRGRSAKSPAQKPEPGSFVQGDFNSRLGSVSYRLYTPKGSARRRMPLVVMLHGCSQTALDFATGTDMNSLADELGFLVLYPQQALSANVALCWNWHSPDNQARGRGEPAVIAALTRHVATLCGANRARIYIAGISAGGATAAIVGAAYPELYTAVGVHSGVALGDIRSIGAALASMRGNGRPYPTDRMPRPLPTIVFHGDSDRVVHPSNAAGFLKNIERSRPGPLACRTFTGRSAGGRDYTRRVYKGGNGDVLLEDWVLHGGGHSWSGGRATGSHTDPSGPSASREMLRFFLAFKRPASPVRAG